MDKASEIGSPRATVSSSPKQPSHFSRSSFLSVFEPCQSLSEGDFTKPHDMPNAQQDLTPLSSALEMELQVVAGEA